MFYRRTSVVLKDRFKPRAHNILSVTHHGHNILVDPVAGESRGDRAMQWHGSYCLSSKPSRCCGTSAIAAWRRRAQCLEERSWEWGLLGSVARELAGAERAKFAKGNVCASPEDGDWRFLWRLGGCSYQSIVAARHSEGAEDDGNSHPVDQGSRRRWISKTPPRDRASNPGHVDARSDGWLPDVQPESQRGSQESMVLSWNPLSGVPQPFGPGAGFCQSCAQQYCCKQLAWWQHSHLLGDVLDCHEPVAGVLRCNEVLRDLVALESKWKPNCRAPREWKWPTHLDVFFQGGNPKDVDRLQECFQRPGWHCAVLVEVAPGKDRHQLLLELWRSNRKV